MNNLSFINYCIACCCRLPGRSFETEAHAYVMCPVPTMAELLVPIAHCQGPDTDHWQQQQQHRLALCVDHPRRVLWQKKNHSEEEHCL